MNRHLISLFAFALVLLPSSCCDHGLPPPHCDAGTDASPCVELADPDLEVCGTDVCDDDDACGDKKWCNDGEPLNGSRGACADDDGCKRGQCVITRIGGEPCDRDAQCCSGTCSNGACLGGCGVIF